MDKYDFFYGTQLAEFERPTVPDVVAKNGIKTDIVGTKYSLKIKAANTKVVILNVYG